MLTLDNYDETVRSLKTFISLPLEKMLPYINPKMSHYDRRVEICIETNENEQAQILTKLEKDFIYYPVTFECNNTSITLIYYGGYQMGVYNDKPKFDNLHIIGLDNDN